MAAAVGEVYDRRNVYNPVEVLCFCFVRPCVRV